MDTSTVLEKCLISYLHGHFSCYLFYSKGYISVKCDFIFTFYWLRFFTKN